jgi:hypothetical protein
VQFHPNFTGMMSYGRLMIFKIKFVWTTSQNESVAQVLELITQVFWLNDFSWTFFSERIK